MDPREQPEKFETGKEKPKEREEEKTGKEKLISPEEVRQMIKKKFGREVEIKVSHEKKGVGSLVCEGEEVSYLIEGGKIYFGVDILADEIIDENLEAVLKEKLKMNVETGAIAKILGRKQKDIICFTSTSGWLDHENVPVAHRFKKGIGKFMIKLGREELEFYYLFDKDGKLLGSENYEDLSEGRDLLSVEQMKERIKQFEQELKKRE